MQYLTEHALAKTGEYPTNISHFSKPCASVAKKYFKVNKTKKPLLGAKICSNICPFTLFSPQSSYSVVLLLEQIMFANKYQ